MNGTKEESSPIFIDKMMQQVIEIEVTSQSNLPQPNDNTNENDLGNKTCHFRVQRFPNLDYKTNVTVKIQEMQSTNQECIKPTKVFSFFGSNIEAANIIALTAHFWASSPSLLSDKMEKDFLNEIPQSFYPGTLPWMSVDAIEPFPFPTENFRDGRLSGSALVNRFDKTCVLTIKRSISYKVDMNFSQKDADLHRNGSQNDGARDGGYLTNFDSKFKIALEYLHETEVLGDGEFGIVHRGLYGGIAVAVKTTKVNADSDYFDAIINEIKVMAFIGEHPNIIKFFGAATGRIRERIVHIVVELSPFGDLETFLRVHRWEFNPEKNCNHESSITTKKMLTWCEQIASGMLHLESKKVVHSDLACRNVLVFPHGVVKLTDFGLSTKLYVYERKIKDKKTKMPWPWMALESLLHFEFNLKSDVWSYGVTIWEIYMLGSVPYSNYQFTSDFLLHLKDGSLRLEKPQLASIEIYYMMVQCWDEIPRNRPHFQQLETFFKDLLNDFKSRLKAYPRTMDETHDMAQQRLNYVQLENMEAD